MWPCVGKSGRTKRPVFDLSSSPALTAPWILGSPFSTQLPVQKNLAESAVSVLAVSGLGLDGWGEWEDKHLPGGLRRSVNRSDSLAGSPSFPLTLLTSKASLTVAAEAQPAWLINQLSKALAKCHFETNWRTCVIKQPGQCILITESPISFKVVTVRDLSLEVSVTPLLRQSRHRGTHTQAVRAANELTLACFQHWEIVLSC